MIRQSNASLGFTRETPEKKPTTGQSMIDGLSRNPETFPNLPVPLTTLSSNNSDLIDALIAAKTGDRVASANLKTVINFNGDAMLVTVGTTTVQIIVTTKSKVSFNNAPGNVVMDMSVYAVNTAGISGIANGQSVITK